MIERSRIEAFVVKKTDYYNDKWQSIGYGTTPRVSFNWAAFFASGLWMLYRKLYPQLGILILVMIADIGIFTYLEEAGIISSGLVAVWDRVSPALYGWVIGSYGNYWYMRRFQRFDEMARNQSPDPSIQESYLRTKGGTNAIGVWAVILLIAALFGVVLVYG